MVVVLGLALYFAYVFGLSGVKTLLWMQLGFTDFATGAIVHSASRMFHWSDRGLSIATAGLGAAKLAVAGYFVVAAAEHAVALFRGASARTHETVGLALFAAAGLTVLYAYPAWIIGESAELRTHFAHVMLLCVAAGASIYRRNSARRRPVFDEDALPEPDDPPIAFGRVFGRRSTFRA